MIKSLTKREKIMLILLVAVLIIVGYTKLVVSPVNKKVEELEAASVSEQESIDEGIISVAEIEKMNKVIANAKKSGKQKSMPVFDSSTELGIELETIFSTAKDYSLNFGDMVKTDTLVKRPVTMTFDTETYEEAASILKTLHESNFTNQIADVSFDIGRGNGRTETVAYVNFYENMSADKKKK